MLRSSCCHLMLTADIQALTTGQAWVLQLHRRVSRSEPHRTHGRLPCSQLHTGTLQRPCPLCCFTRDAAWHSRQLSTSRRNQLTQGILVLACLYCFIDISIPWPPAAWWMTCPAIKTHMAALQHPCPNRLGVWRVETHLSSPGTRRGRCRV